MEQPNYNQQQEVPNATLILVFGILSIVFCFCYGILGLVFGILSVVFASKSSRLYKQNPNIYTLGSYKNMQAGKICGIIGLSLSALFVLIVLIYIAFWGYLFSSILPWEELLNSGVY